MRPVQRSASVYILKHTLRLVLVLSFLLVIGATSAQEMTPEPAQPTDQPTEIPADSGIAPTAVPTEVPTEVPTDMPTELPTVEVPTVEPTPADMTPVPTEVVPTPIPQFDQFIEDFQDNETSGWILTSNWAILTENANAFLSAALPQESAVLQAVNWPYFSLVFRVRVDEGGIGRAAFSSAGHSFVIALTADGSVSLYQDSVLVGQSAGATTDPNQPFTPVWRTVQILAPGYVVAVKVDEFTPVSVTDLSADGGSGLSFGTTPESNGAVAFDDIVVTRLDAPPPAPIVEAVVVEPTDEVVPESNVEATPEVVISETPEVTLEATVEVTDEAAAAPLILTAESLQKLPVPLQELLMHLVNGDAAAVNASAATNYITLDEQGRLEVILWMRSESDAALVAAEVQTTGGIIRDSFSIRLTVQVTPEQLLALANRPEVNLIELPSRAVSTASQNGFIAGPLQAPTGSTATAGMDVIGASAWHLASTPVLGSGVDIVVIDTGFNAPFTAEHNCVPIKSVVFGGPTLGTDTDHGMRVVEVLCDVAPNSAVYLYKATNATGLASAINTAVVNGIEVILITMDLGASISPGDGTGGGALYGIDNVYTAITNARNAGRTVIVSAGNNRGRYVTLNWNGTNSSIPMQIFAGDTIHVSWNDWSNTLNGATLENFGLSLSGDLNQTIRTGGSARVGPPRQTYTVPAGTCVSGCDVNLAVNGFAGDPGNVIVQIQVAGRGTINEAGITGSPVLTSAGNIGRPADSPDAIAVGAVCTDYLGRFPLDTNSANGPVFGTGGGAPSVTGPFLRDQVKPDLVGPSHVSVSGLAANPFDCFDGSGFNGTSAAAAHVAGMVALMISNTNSGMAAFDSANSLGVDAIQNYLQTRAIDLPFFDFSSAPQGMESTSILSDSFDMTYGAGLATLGSPTFNLANSINPQTAADTLPAACDATPIYVGQAAPSLPQSGTLANPYVSLQYALRQSTSNDCVVVMPGEYTSPIYIPQAANAPVVLSYESATSFASSASNFWIVNNYNLQAGIAIKNNDIVFDGFTINPGDVYKVIPGSKDAIPMLISDSSGTVVRNSVFTGFKSALLVSDGSGVQITGNSFLNFAIPSTSTPFGPQPIADTAVLSIRGSAAPAQVNIVSNNLFQGANIVNFPIQTSGWVSAVISVRTSAVDVVRNRFNTNTSATLIGVNQWVAPGEVTKITSEIRVVGNLMTSNTINGPLLHLYQAPNLRFVNNTVLNNSMSGGTDFDAFFLYGFPGQSSLPQLSDRRVEIHNNLFYGNGGVFRGLIYQQLAGGGFIACTSINGGIPIRNNWFVPLELSTTQAGVCQNTAQNTYIANSVVDVITPATEASVFFTTLADAANPYRLRPITSPVPGFVGGINTGDNQALIDIYGNPGYLSQFDLRSAERVRAGANANQLPPPTVVDIGAYELEVPSAPTAISPSPVNIVEDSTNAVSFTLTATGGYVQTFALGSPLPGNYDTDPNNACGGQPVRFTPPNVVTYCPPANFNTQSPTNAPIVIPFTVSDPIFYPGQVSQGTITLNIQAVNDGSPTAASFRLLTDYVTPLTQQLLPTYRLGNFELIGAASGVDYPFTYTFTGRDNSLVGANNDLLRGCPTCDSTETVLTNAFNEASTNGGVLTINPVPGQQGAYRFFYRIADRDGDSATGTITLVVLPSLAKEGSYDDASLYLTYSGTGWTPSFTTTASNNTLHTTTVATDGFEFPFNGAAVRLNLIGSNTGTAATNTLSVRFRLDLGSGVSPQLTYAQAQTALSGQGYTLTCTNSLNNQPPDAGSNIVNFSTTGAAYSLLCTGLPSDQASAIVLTSNLNGAAFTVDSMDVASGVLQAGKSYQETSANFTYSGVWTAASGTGPLGGAHRYTNDPNGRVTFRVDSSVGRLVFYRTLFSIYGSTEIRVDGTLVATMNNTSSTLQWGQPYLLNLTPGDHVIELRNVGTTYSNVDQIDALPPAQALGPGVYQENNLNFIYTGNWITAAGAGPLGGAHRYTNDPNGRMSFKVASGVERIIFYRTMFSIYGSTGIYLNGSSTPVAVMNNTSSTLLWGQPFVLTLPAGTTTVELRNVGTNYSNVDQIELLGTTQPLGPGIYQESEINFTYTGTWVTAAGTGPLGGAHRYTNDPNGRMSFKVTSAVERVIFYRTTFSIYGSTEIYLNGASVPTATMNNNSAALLWGQPFVLTLPPGTTTVELRNVGTNYSNVDQIELLGTTQPLDVGTYQENEINFSYSGVWTTAAGTGPLGGAHRYTNDPNGRMTFKVTSNVQRVVFFRTTFTIYGSTEIYLNGSTTPAATMNNNSATLLWGQPFVLTLPPGTTTIQLKNVGTNYSNVDQIVLLSSSTALGPGSYQENYPDLQYTGVWTTAAGSGPLGGAHRITNDASGRMSFSVTSAVGRIIFYRTMFSMYGSTTIHLNGSATPIATMNNTSATLLWGQPFVLTLPPGTTTVELRNVGTNYSAVDQIDLLPPAVALGPGSYQENETNFTYTGVWTTAAGSGPLGGAHRITNDASGRMSFSVTSAVGRIIFYRTMFSMYGSTTIHLNGSATPIATMNNTSATLLWGQPFVLTLPPGTTTVELRNVGTNYSAVDQIDLLPPAVALGPGSYQENETNFTYTGAWTTAAGSGPLGGAHRITNDASGRMSFSVTSAVGRIIFYRTMFSMYGSTTIHLNGSATPIATMNNTSATLLWGQPFVLTLPPGTTTVELRNVGTNYSAVDQIDLLGAAQPLSPGLVEESSGNFTYTGTWQAARGVGPSGDVAFYTSTPGATVSFSFTGDGLVFYRTLVSNGGSFSITIDGVPQNFTSANATTVWQQPIDFANLGAGTHTVVVTNTSLSSASLFYFDAVRVVNSSLPITVGSYQNTYPALNYTGSWNIDGAGGLSGGAASVTTTNGSQMGFSFQGTGFSVFTFNTPNSPNMEICYTISGGSPVCNTYATSANPTQATVGYSFYNLRQGTYAVTVRHVGTNGQGLYLDRIAVLDTPPTVLQPGSYEDSAAGIVYSSPDLWPVSAHPSHSGGTVRGTTQRGAVVQIRFNGNALVIYQFVGPTTGSNVNLCVRLSDAAGNTVSRCTNFSQRSAVTTLFSAPVAFYGFGSGSHEVILENRTHGALFNIDRILVN